MAATIYMSLMGRQGLRDVALQSHSKAVWAKDRLSKVPGCRTRYSAPFFNEFVLELPSDPEKINQRLLSRGFIGGLPLGRYFPESAGLKNASLICVTEMNTREEIENLAAALGEVLR